jgi:CDGSH-type Zn-finger protein
MSASAPRNRQLAETAAVLADRLDAGGGESERAAAARLRASVVRPLGRRGAAAKQDRRSTDPVSEQLWQLAQAATRARLEEPAVAALAEATAALQDLAHAFAGDAAGERLAELQELQAPLVPQIQVEHNGPYLATNADRLLDWLGRPLPTRPTMALCRCGASETKPFCDGSHAHSGFTEAKDPNRVPDRRDTYVGQQVTVLDNRGICQHSGFCTDRLNTVFRQGQEPFVAPSGGRMDEIIRAVRDCPSGALSYAIDGVEARAQVDHQHHRPPEIEISKDGPYRVRGGLRLVDHAGDAVARDEGASLEHYALCRCGHSQNKPFCSGMHWYIEFHDPTPDPEQTPTIFEWAGGLPALTRLTRLFYEKHVPEDPLLTPLFANMSQDHPERVAKWLAEVFCGPHAYSDEYGGYPRMLSQHRGRCLNEEQRTRWVALLLQSAREAGLPNDAEFRSAFGAYIEWGSRLAVENSQTGAEPPEHMPMPHWDWNTAAGPPGSRISALTSQDDDQEVTFVPPQPGEAPSFATHIKPLFRERDRRSMQFAFDLWNQADVTEHADAILTRLRAGTMPCDGAWSDAQIDLFEQWIAAGTPA